MRPLSSLLIWIPAALFAQDDVSPFNRTTCEIARAYHDEDVATLRQTLFQLESSSGEGRWTPADSLRLLQSLRLTMADPIERLSIDMLGALPSIGPIPAEVDHFEIKCTIGATDAEADWLLTLKFNLGETGWLLRQRSLSGLSARAEQLQRLAASDPEAGAKQLAESFPSSLLRGEAPLDLRDIARAHFGESKADAMALFPAMRHWGAAVVRIDMKFKADAMRPPWFKVGFERHGDSWRVVRSRW